MRLAVELGVDLCRVAVQRGDQARLASDTRDRMRFATPSAFHLVDPTALLGQAAIEHRLIHPAARVDSLFAQPSDAEAVTRIALMLRKLLADAAAVSTERASETLIAVPPWLTATERRRVRDAAHALGLTGVEVLNSHLVYVDPGTETLVLEVGLSETVLTRCQVGDAGPECGTVHRWEDCSWRVLETRIVERVEALHRPRAAIPMTDVDTAQARHRAAATLGRLFRDSAPRSEVWRVGGQILEVQLTRELLNEWIDAMVAPVLAEIRPNDTLILLDRTGGLPDLADRLGRGGARVRALDDETPILALLSAQRSKVLQQSEYDLGFRIRSASGDGVDVVIPARALLPAEGRRTYYTTRADQQRFVIDIVEAVDDAIAPVGQLHFPIEGQGKNRAFEFIVRMDERREISVLMHPPAGGPVRTQPLERTPRPELEDLERWVTIE